MSDTVYLKGVDVPANLVFREFGLMREGAKATHRQIREIPERTVRLFRQAVKACGFGKVYWGISSQDTEPLSEWECGNILADMGFRVTKAVATATPAGSLVMNQIEFQIWYVQR